MSMFVDVDVGSGMIATYLDTLWYIYISSLLAALQRSVSHGSSTLPCLTVHHLAT